VPGAALDVPAPPPFDRVAFTANDVPAYVAQFAVHTPFTDVVRSL
jgi:hypothetical protein